VNLSWLFLRRARFFCFFRSFFPPLFKSPYNLADSLFPPPIYFSNPPPSPLFSLAYSFRIFFPPLFLWACLGSSPFFVFLGSISSQSTQDPYYPSPPGSSMNIGFTGDCFPPLFLHQSSLYGVCLWTLPCPLFSFPILACVFKFAIPCSVASVLHSVLGLSCHQRAFPVSPFFYSNSPSQFTPPVMF